ncbi:hypothetical protein FN846DRAFT_1002711 [Sphaerosporella brunnea]|uniref:Uncharacterized protein n=1 Tax=Sphaerosporella brunnea TaxID=1250544 RepID=A0A5J5EEY4_9PEZI|nr:hypothetical protein FN846DRAFT_1002711 [Sphaerosporella brunnea]
MQALRRHPTLQVPRFAQVAVGEPLDLNHPPYAEWHEPHFEDDTPALETMAFLERSIPDGDGGWDALRVVALTYQAQQYCFMKAWRRSRGRGIDAEGEGRQGPIKVLDRRWLLPLLSERYDYFDQWLEENWKGTTAFSADHAKTFSGPRPVYNPLPDCIDRSGMPFPLWTARLHPNRNLQNSPPALQWSTSHNSIVAEYKIPSDLDRVIHVSGLDPQIQR